MDQYDNTDSGVLFKNDRKEHEAQPDYKGNLNVGGVEYWISGWIKKFKSGENVGQSFMSLAVTQKETHAPQQEEPPLPEPTGEDVPF